MDWDDMTGGEMDVETLCASVAHLAMLADQWRRRAKWMFRTEQIRFRGSVNDQVWERDLIIATKRKWERMKAERPNLACWSTARFGPLVLALSPPPIVVLSDPDAGVGLDDGLDI